MAYAEALPYLAALNASSSGPSTNSKHSSKSKNFSPIDASDVVPVNWLGVAASVTIVVASGVGLSEYFGASSSDQNYGSMITLWLLIVIAVALFGWAIIPAILSRGKKAAALAVML